jgi:hypothetical protein
MLGGDSTANWVYNTSVVRPSNNNSANKITAFQGLQEEGVIADFRQNITQSATNSQTQVGIGVNSTTATSGFTSQTSGPNDNRVVGSARYMEPSGILGIANYQMLENSPGASATTTFNGTQGNMQMIVSYRG